MIRCVTIIIMLSMLSEALETSSRIIYDFDGSFQDNWPLKYWFGIPLPSKCLPSVLNRAPKLHTTLFSPKHIFGNSDYFLKIPPTPWASFESGDLRSRMTPTVSGNFRKIIFENESIDCAMNNARLRNQWRTQKHPLYMCVGSPTHTRGASIWQASSIHNSAENEIK